ncbi:MAG TPA: hypothetical protein VGV18_13105 [Verrucomicrobiae bacterium]|nr:hypothetical protein [Verrucomicrobiae bacterium]
MNNSQRFKTSTQCGAQPKTSEPPEPPLLVKELAASLGVSPRFVYQMRACGFPMRGDTRLRQAATLEEARAWIKANGFRLSSSVGIVERTKGPRPRGRG